MSTIFTRIIIRAAHAENPISILTYIMAKMVRISGSEGTRGAGRRGNGNRTGTGTGTGTETGTGRTETTVGFSLTTEGVKGQLYSFSRVRTGGAGVGRTDRISGTRGTGGKGARKDRTINRTNRINRTRSA